MRESILYQKLENKKVKCLTCNHYCLLSPKQRGICGVRENKKGKLVALNYPYLIAEEIDPIEKKPFYHFMPGTFSLSIATAGCNFHCLWCQNWTISQLPKEGKNKNYWLKMSFKKTPKQIIREAKKFNTPSISYTYTEPTIFLELAIETMKLAHKEKIKNNWVSNGYFSQETFKLIRDYLDAINIDFKFIDEKKYLKYCGAKLEPILKNMKQIKKAGIHLELTTLVISSLNDSLRDLRKMARFIKKELGADTPWHLSRFFPAYKMKNAEITPLNKLNRAYLIAKKEGLKNVYVGNV